MSRLIFVSAARNPAGSLYLMSPLPPGVYASNLVITMHLAGHVGHDVDGWRAITVARFVSLVSWRFIHFSCLEC